MLRTDPLSTFAFAWLATAVNPQTLPALSGDQVMPYIIQRLDVLTFPSGLIGPRRRSGKVALSDYGFEPERVSSDYSDLVDKQTEEEFTIQILTRDFDTISVCVSESVFNGGTYHATFPLSLKQELDGYHLEADTIPDRPDCALVRH